jgi:hypothetical protein
MPVINIFPYSAIAFAICASSWREMGSGELVKRASRE